MSEQDQEQVRIVLTPEQRELVRRMSGQNIDAIELEPGDPKTGAGAVKFLWRLSVASGIPRLQWSEEENAPEGGK
ncbi:MAG TPA: hypothetical protein VGM77_06795 [Gemmatimonadales bacterium]|jgi:hypothetical protein